MIDRRRATRTGTDVVVARSNAAVPPFDVPRPLKTPRRPALQVLMMGVGLLFAGDAEPASTCLKLRVELLVGLPAIAICVLTCVRSKRLLGET